ncbi:MAG: hypothetical protein J1F06_01085 [Prevotellaceae bacterium]|nr:hypothetical protein [Prevotellaceae bacterium]
MRKITFLFYALLLGCIGAVAQTSVASLSDLSNSKVYAIKSARDNGNEKYLLYDAASAPNNLASNYSNAGVNKTFSEDDTAFHFAIYQSAKTGFYYLYSIAGNMFVGHSDGDNDPIPMTETITNTTEIRVKESDDPFRFLLSTNGTGALNVADKANCHGVLNWRGGYNQTNDAGNVFSFIEIGDLEDPTIAAIEAAVVKFEGRSLTSIDEIDNNHIYTLKTNRGNWGANQGFLIYHSECPDNVASTYGSGYPNLKFSPANSQFHWAIYKSEKTGKYYFYSVAGEKFIGSSTDGDSKPVALVSAITNDVEIRMSNAADAGYPFVLSTNKWALNTAGTAGAHGVVSWEGGYNNLTDGGNTYQISEIAEITEEMQSTIAAAVDRYENAATITFIYYIDGREYTRDIVEHDKNISLSVPEKDYVTILSHDFTNTTVTEDATVNVICKENLPFTASTNFANATWYAVDIHSNQNNYYWTYVSDNEKNVQTPVLTTSSKNIIADEHLWCFVGNLIDGFKIYNKAAGESMTLRKGTSAFELSTTDDNNILKIQTSLYLDGATCFTLDGTNFINHQTENEGSLHLLKTWTARDYGSSCRFFAPSTFMLNCAEAYLSHSEAPAGAVGTNTSITAISAQLQTAVENVTANPHNESEMTTLSALLNQIDDNSIVEMVAGRYYRIQNYLRKDNAGNGKMIGLNNNGQRIASDAGKTDVSYIWKFEDCTENGEVGYKIYSPNQKGYMKPANDNSLSDTYQNGGRYRLVDLGGAQFNIKDGNNQNLVIYSSGSVGSWNPNPKDSDGAWYIIPATDIEIALNEGEGSYWASTYLPFGVSAQDGSDLQILTGSVSGEYLKLNEIETLPAETGAILKGTADTYTLYITEATESASSDLQGTLTEQTDITPEDYLVLGMADGKVGLYKTNATTLKANKAYLPASVAGQNVNVLRFSFGEPTGIDSTVAGQDESKATLYDLSGRRIAVPTHGIYVKDGKKVFVR